MQNAILKNKKGFNDITIAGVIIFIFFGTAIMIPFVNEAFDQNLSTFNTENFIEGSDGVRANTENVGRFNAFKVLLTVIKLALHDVGNTLGLPFWLDAIYTGLFIIFVLVIARNIWIGGGG